MSQREQPPSEPVEHVPGEPPRRSSEQGRPEARGPERSAFESLGEERLTLVQEFWLFVRENRAWWLTPILIVLGLVGVLAALAATGAAPFIYTLF